MFDAVRSENCAPSGWLLRFTSSKSTSTSRQRHVKKCKKLLLLTSKFELIWIHLFDSMLDSSVTHLDVMLRLTFSRSTCDVSRQAKVASRWTRHVLRLKGNGPWDP